MKKMRTRQIINPFAVSKHSVAMGFLFGAGELTNFEFDSTKPYAGCRLCGVLYQTPANRLGDVEGLALWREIHNKKHTEKEHIALIHSGRWATPEAAQKLAPFGIFSPSDVLFDNEVNDALAKAPRTPSDDSEC